MSERRNYRAACGKQRRYYVQTAQGDFWGTQAGADTEQERDAAVERVRAKYPERTVRVVEFVGGGRIEREVTAYDDWNALDDWAEGMRDAASY